MTALDGNLGGPGTLGGTLAATLGTLQGGTLGGGGNTKKVSKAFGNAWRGAAAYHYYMLSLRQFYDGEEPSPLLCPCLLLCLPLEDPCATEQVSWTRR